MSHLRFTACACLVAMSALGFVGQVDLAAAEESSYDDSSVLAYRRILVPADRPDAWPRAGAQFLPVDAGEFTAMVDAANRPLAAAHIVDAEYSARLEGNRLVDGRGRWTIEHHGEGPTLLALDPTTLLVRQPVWRHESSDSAMLGWWSGQAGAPSVFGLRVERSGELEFAWHTPQGESTGAALEIPLQLPAATRGRLVLHLPPGKQPNLVGAVLLATNSDPAAPAGATQRWEFALGQSDPLRLRVFDATSIRSDNLFDVAVHHRLQYDVTQRGLEIGARLRLTPRRTLPRELRIVLPANTHLVGASLGDRPLTWRVAADATGNASEAVVAMPELPPRQPVELELRAWGPLVTGEKWRLPRIDVEDAFWTSGAVNLSLDQSLELRDLQLGGCVQSAVESAGPDHATKVLTFDVFSPEHFLDLTVVPRRVNAHASLGTSLKVGSTEVEGRVVADLGVDRGQLHSVSAELMPGWTVDAVEAIPADTLGQWYVDVRDGVRRLELQLRRAVTRSQGVSIVVTGRQHRATPADFLPQPSLSMLRWRDIEIARSLLLLDADEPYELVPIGPMHPLPIDELSDRDRGLIAGPGDGQVFDWRSPPAEAAFRLAPKRGSYDAHVNIDAVLYDARLRTTYRVVCRPRESGIDRVLVHLSEPAPTGLRWMDEGAQEQLRAERVAENDPRLAGLPPGGELWAIDLRRLYARPLTITATTEASWPGRRRVPLVSLPDAAEQQGRVVVRTADSSPPVAVALGMTPAPPPVGETNAALGGRTSNSLAVYRYQPVRFYAAAATPELWLGPSRQQGPLAKLVAAEVRIDSYVATDGTGAHRVTYHLTKTHADRVPLTLVPGTHLESATLNGEPATVTIDDAAPQVVSIRLPPSGGDSVLVLELRSEGAPLTNGGQVASPLPETDEMNLLGGVWNLCLPGEFAALGPTAGNTNSPDWRKRLFGPLARSQNALPFRPWRTEDWNNLLAPTLGPPALAATPAESQNSDESPVPDGWNAYRVPFVALRPEPITVAHPPATSVWGLLLFLICVLAGVVGRVRFKHWLPGVAIAGLIALALPASYAPVATGVFLGWLAAPLFHFAWRFAARDAAPSVGGKSAMPLLLLMIVTGFAAFTSTALAETEGDASNAHGRIHRVLIPVDAEGQPSGDRYFVSDEFLRELLRRAEDGADAGRWLLRDMRCDAELARRPGEDAANVGAWTLTLEVQVLTRDSAIRLPLVREEAVWPEEASLDGIPAPIEWNDDGRGCRIAVAEPGRYRLVLRCEPRAREVAGRRVVELSVPPVAGGQIRLISAARLVEPRIGTLPLEVRGKSMPFVWQGEFDGSGRLSVSWAAGSLDADAAKTGVTDELQWLRIRRSGIELDVKYLTPWDSRRPRTLGVLFDNRWELVAVDGCELAEAPRQLEHAPSEDSTQLRLPIGNGERREVRLRFQLRDATVLGRLRVPMVRLSSSAAARRWLAISTDPALKCEPEPGSGGSNATVDDFLAAWGGPPAIEPPQLVLSRADDAIDVRLSIAPRTIDSMVNQRTNVVVGRERFLVEYLADVEPQAEARFRWTLAVPERFVVEQLGVEQAGKVVPSEWSRDASNRVKLFFDKAMDAAYRIRLVGSMPHQGDGLEPLPYVSTEETLRSIQTVTVYREEDVRVTLHEPIPVSPEDLPLEPSPGSLAARFVGAMVVDSSAAGDVRVTVAPNEPTVLGSFLTQLDHAEGLWFARLTVAARVTQGDVGTLRFRVPATWKGPFETSLDGTIQRTPVDKATATLTVRLARTVRRNRDIRFELRGPLVFNVGESVAVPQVEPETPGRWQQFVAVPGSLRGEKLSWTQAGVQPSDVAPELHSDFPADYQTFRAVADSIHVSLRPAPVEAAPATVRLAETAVFLGPAGGQCTLTRFVITPQRLTQCTVELPTADQLVQIKLDGREALLQPLTPQEWRVQLGPPNFPQLLEIVTRRVDRIDVHARAMTLQRPKLRQGATPIAAELSLWSLFRPAFDVAPWTGDASASTPLELATLRLERLTSASEAATRAVVESPVADGYNWFSGWADELRTAQQAARDAQHRAVDLQSVPRVIEPADDPLATALARSDAWINQLNEVFAGPDLSDRESQPLAARALDSWRLLMPAGAVGTHFVADGDRDTLAVEFAPSAITAGQSRFLAAASIVALALAAGWLARREAWRWFPQWPFPAIVLVGLAAWAWLWPSWLGVLIVAAGMALWMRAIARARSPRSLD